MKTHYGFYTLTFLVIANMIGAGVFTTSGFALADLGSPGMVVAAWIVGGLIAIAGAASYGMLSRVMPESGGEYLFLSQAAHPLLGYIAGWVSLLAGFSGAIAFAALAMEGYLVSDQIRPNWLPTGTIAITTIGVAALIHGWRPLVGAFTQNLAVVLKLILLALILAFAAFQILLNSSPVSPELAGASQNVEFESWRQLMFAFAGSLVWISLSYSGFNAAVYVASEVQDAQRVIPRALLTGTLIVVVIYVLLNAVFVFGPPAAEIKGKQDVAAIAARWLGGRRFEDVVRWTIVLCLLTSVFSMMMAAPRVYARMADDGLLPQWLKTKGAAPWSATITQAAIAIVLVMLSDLQGLLSYLGLTLSLSAASSVACLFLPSIRQRLHNGDQSGSAMRFAAPMFYLIATLTSASIMAFNKPQYLIATAITVLFGIVTYVVAQQRKKPA